MWGKFVQRLWINDLISWFLPALISRSGEPRMKKLQPWALCCSTKIRTVFGSDESGGRSGNSLRLHSKSLIASINQNLIIFLRKLRRCGKKMPRFCDVNNDKKITLSEWLNCLQTQRTQNEQPQSSAQTHNGQPKPTAQAKLKLNGKNPLEYILRED